MSILKTAIETELRERCQGRPAKRQALQLALILAESENDPGKGREALWRLEEIRNEISRGRPRCSGKLPAARKRRS